MLRAEHSNCENKRVLRCDREGVTCPVSGLVHGRTRIQTQVCLTRSTNEHSCFSDFILGELLWGGGGWERLPAQGPSGQGDLDGQDDAKTSGGGSSVGRSGERQGPEEGVEDELRGISLHVGQRWTPGDQASQPTGGFCPAEERPWPQRSPMQALFC